MSPTNQQITMQAENPTRKTKQKSKINKEKKKKKKKW